MKVVSAPTEEVHACGPGWVWYDEPFPAHYWITPWNVAVGTVVECDCGQTWVCVRIPGTESPVRWTAPYNDWRKETKRERRRREGRRWWER